MSVKLHQQDTFDIIMSAVNKVVNLIKPTYGPASNKVIISKVTHRMTVDDGVQIARDIELEDPAENAVLNVIRETAVRTNDRVGDGTTGAMIMLQSIMNEVSQLPNRDGAKIEKELKKGVEEAKTQLLAMAKPVNSKEELRKVARISFDDETISEVIADTWHRIGKEGVVTVDRSGTMETFADVTEGVTMNRGFISPYMVSNPQRMEAVVEKPLILLTDQRLTEVKDVLPLMNKLVEKQIYNLVVVCETMEGAALSTTIVNKVQGKFNLVAISVPPGDKEEFLKDLGVMLGAKVFSEKKGDKLELVEIADLGKAERFIARREESVIISPKGKRSEISKAINDLRASLSSTKSQHDKQWIEKRIAFFAGKVAVVKVGAATENEERALRYKVEDAVNATQAAFKGGVVCGAGLSLSRLTTSSSLLNQALQTPFKQLKLNVGIENHRLLKDDEAINAVSGEIGKFMSVGVIDPVDVLIAALESAVSIASLLVTTKGMIVEQPKHIPENAESHA
jgi:chaperonin GroEL